MGKNQHVIPHESGWAVRGEGNRRATSVHRTRADAIEAARRIANGQQSEVLVHRKGGKDRGREPVDPVIELLERRAQEVPAQVQAEMLAQLKSGLDEHRMSPRKLFP